MLLAQAVEAGVALHAFVAVDGGALDRGIDIDRAHRADVGAVAAGDAFIWIDLHRPDSAKIRRVASILQNNAAAIRQRPPRKQERNIPAVGPDQIRQQRRRDRASYITAVFMTAETEPA